MVQNGMLTDTTNRRLEHGARYISTTTISIHIVCDVRMWQQLSTKLKPKAG